MRGLVVAALLALSTAAHADGPAADNRVGLVVQGTAGLRGRLADHLDEQLSRTGFSAEDAPLSRDALNTLANCFLLDDMKCARGVIEARSKIPRVLVVRVEESGGTVTIDLTWFSAGNPPLSEHATCESCRETFAETADAPLQRLAKAAPTPLVTAEPPPPPPPASSRFWPITMIAAGSVTAVAGGVALYYGLRDGETHKYIYPQLTPVGIAMLAVGAGTAIGGVILMPSGNKRSQPVAAVSRGSAYLGWFREF
jgi:hypothetical protein